MTNYIVHIYREMRLVFEGIEADTPEAAAAIARDKLTGDADDIESCDGETFAALVDVAGDKEYGQSRTIDFEPERQRKAAPKLLAACRMVVDRWEGGDLAEAARACSAAIAEAKADGFPSNPAEVDVHALLAGRRQIAAVWSVEDVQEVRPDLDADRAWEVLEVAKDSHQADIGINWSVLESHAEMLYGDAPETDEASGGGHE